MAENNKNVTILLDRLYNLTGEDNIVIKEIEERIANAEQKVSEIEESIAHSKSEQDEKERKLSLFLTQKEQFEKVFEGLTDESFSALRGINVNLEVGTLLSTVESKAPEYVELLMSAINDHKKRIEELEEEKNSILAELVKLKEELIVQNERRTQLTSLLEQSLSPNEIERESLTPIFVKKVLSPFGIFSPEEITSLTKLIMFPDDGLYEYDEKYEERRSKGLVGFIEEDEEEITLTEEGTSLLYGNGDSAPVVEEDEDELTASPVTTGKTTTIEEGVEGPAVTLTFQQLDEDEELVDESSKKGEAVEDEEFEGPPVVLDFQQLEGKEDLDETVEIKVVTDKKTEVEAKEEKVITTGAIIPPVVEEDAEAVDEEELDATTALGIVPAAAGAITTEVVEDEEVDYSETIATLTNLGFELEKFELNNTQPIEEIYKSASQVDEEVLRRNFEILRSIGLGEEAYKMRFNHMYITDVDFNKKITLLRVKNISEQKIKTLIKTSVSGLRLSYTEIENRIQAIENLHGKVDDSNIYLISKDIAKYKENLDTLLRHGIDIDDKEARNHMAILFDSLYIPKNVEILKQYIISILKSNGKYALSVFWKTPEELLFSIDDLVEGGLENVIVTHPEVLGMSTEQLLRRAKFCEQEGKDVFTDNMRSEIHDYITKPERFRKQFGYVTLPELTERNTTNSMLENVIGNPDYVEILLNTLEDYYSNTDTYTVPEIDDSLKDTYENLCQYLEEKGNAKLAGKFTYDIDGVSICKNKLERHIAVILNALTAADQPINGVEREIALVAALYNSRLTEEQLRKVAGSCLGFNSNAQEVITL